MLGGMVFHLEATHSNGVHITSFSPPMTLTVSYDESELPNGLDEVYLKVSRYDVDLIDWVALPVINRDLPGDKITVTLDHFSEFILAAPGGVKILFTSR